MVTTWVNLEVMLNEIYQTQKYKYYMILKFTKFEKCVMTFYFKRIRPLWVKGETLLEESFDTTTNADTQEVTQAFLYNSRGKRNFNVARVCTNFQDKINSSGHKKTTCRHSLPAGTLIDTGHRTRTQ